MRGEATVPFRELLCNIVDNRGKTCPTSPAGLPLIATNCVRNEHLYPAYETERCVDNETYTTWFRGHPKPGDLLFVTKGSPGRTCMVPDPVDFCIAQDMVAIRADATKVYPRFLFALLRSRQVQEQIDQLHVGTMIPHFKKGDFDKLQLGIPVRHTQEFVGDLYFNLSAKIELNRRMNGTLEATARAIFKSWFVDFDPVRAKAAGQPPPGLKPELAALFPDAFEDSELGEIPKGWRVVGLGEVVDVVKGRSYTSAELQPSQTALVTLKSFARGGGYREDGLKPYTGKFKPDQVIEPGEVVIACTDVTQAAEVIGRTAIVRGSPEHPRLVASLDTMILRPRNPEITRAFLYFLGRTDSFVSHTYAHTTGTTVLHLAKNAVPSYEFALPSADLMAAFDHKAGVAIEQLALLEYESRTLAALRDTLLPKLISGELRVPDAERIVGRAL